MASGNLRTILGTMEFGRRLDLKKTRQMMEEFKESKSSLFEVDTAFMYAGGKTEEFMGEVDVTHCNSIQVATKANPWDGKLLTAEGVRFQLETSLKRLNVPSVHLFYLHAPDHKTPIAETLKGVNELYKEGKFKEFGLSNYASWEVAEVYTICKLNNWILPTVYQGMYNYLTRQVETELFPCLKHFGMRFYAYNPLAGGILTGKHNFEDANKTEPGRFFGKQSWAKAYRDRFWKKENFNCLEDVKATLDEVYGTGKVSPAEAAYRWLFHHSALDTSKGDGVILGASTLDHFRTNMEYPNKEPLDAKVVEQMERCWAVNTFTCPKYFR